ncbi:zinc ribbon domain-containing protein [Candidatus Poseidoniaceae archaeon]|nr:zinc ribbon domain-containing protein [Candidatus Poseidoniaceae archaeon]
MARQFTALILLFTPALVLNALRFLVTPLGEMMAVSVGLDVILHIISLAFGIFLFRKTRVVRDHEWQRSKAVKAVGNQFKAEERGVWEKDVVMETQLSVEGQANLKGQVSGLTGNMTSVGDREIESEVEVEMLIDAEHVRRAQARVSGDEQFEDGAVHSTIGAVTKTSPMDTFLDFIASLRGRDRKAERDAKKSASLSARSNESPVIAQRPIAPIQPIESEERKPSPMEMVSVTDTGIETVTINEETNEISRPVVQEMSIEQMAYGAPPTRKSTGGSQAGLSPLPACKSCGANNPVGERFCSNCGIDL